MNTPLELAALSDTSLVDLASRLTEDLVSIDAQTAHLELSLSDARRRLFKPGTKLALNAFSAVVGVVFAPATFGLSLVATVVSAAVVAWDGVDYGRDTLTAINVHLEARRLHADAQRIEAQLAEIEVLLARRRED